ncbi:MAG: hypothetical protein ABL977_00595 [Candidatus Eisenbacteria bacterium]
MRPILEPGAVVTCHARPGLPRLRAWAAMLLMAALLATPASPVRASASDDGSESRVGVILTVVCGLSLKAAIPAPVPWAGIALVSCAFGFLDAALSPDGP